MLAQASQCPGIGNVYRNYKRKEAYKKYKLLNGSVGKFCKLFKFHVKKARIRGYNLVIYNRLFTRLFITVYIYT